MVSLYGLTVGCCCLFRWGQDFFETIPLCVVDEVLRCLVLNFSGWSGIVLINDSCDCLPRGSGVVDATVVLCLISVLDEL